MLLKPLLVGAIQHCEYKAWLLSQNDLIATTNGSNEHDPLTLAVLQLNEGKLAPTAKLYRKAVNLLEELTTLLNGKTPPPFYKNGHCNICQFKRDCFLELKQRDCISLLAGMTPTVVAKYHNKGITTIRQLAYLFRPRRRNALRPQNNWLFELKALALREQKTFVLHRPALPDAGDLIFIDFEGLPEQNLIYLIGVLIVRNGQTIAQRSFWADNNDDCTGIFSELLKLIGQYPSAPIFHYGSYESKALRSVVRQNTQLPKAGQAMESRMINLLSFLRSHVYPPIYGNGLKELCAFLGFNWSDPNADGAMSIRWRRQWEEQKLDVWKDKLITYNLEDCRALHAVYQWLILLANGNQEKVQQVSQLKKHTPYHLQKNSDYSDDFQHISKAAYFDYQRSKIYWRDELKKQTPVTGKVNDRPRPGLGKMAWQPKKVNEIVIAEPLKKCPHCGHVKLYQSHETKSAVRQTDLKFTPTGIRQHVVEYRSGSAKCAACRKKTMNKALRVMHYGDNLFALIINYYVNFHISHEMISKLIREQYGIWISPMYLVSYKNDWWGVQRWQVVSDYIRRIVLNSPVIHIDETTIKLSRESGYVWVFATSHSVFYHYTPTREVGFLQDWLADYQGIVVSDFYPGYDTLKIKSQKCLIHFIRDLNDDLFKNQFDEDFKGLVSAFNKLLRIIVESIDKHGLKAAHLKKHEKDVAQFFKNHIDNEHRSELAGKYAKRFKRNWHQLWTFLSHDEVPWNNNNAEAAVKAFAQHRRGVKGQMHVKGIQEYLQMLTVAQTCRYRNISFLQLLRGKNGIWEHIPPDALPGFLPFEQARLYIHGLKLAGVKEWNEWKSDGKRPHFIPSAPDKTYKNKGWQDWGDWLGTGFLPFTKARTHIRRLDFKNGDDYRKWLAGGNKPRFIPSDPQRVYKHTGWAGLRDYLGVSIKASQ